MDLDAIRACFDGTLGGVGKVLCRLRVSAPVLFSDTLGGRLTAEFIRRFPDVHLEWLASDRQIDLVDETIDVAIRVNPRPDSELVGRHFANDVMLVVAPPSLPMPEASTAETPARVPAVAMTGLADIDAWQFEADEQSLHLAPDYRLHLSSLTMVRAAVRAGAGAALLPRSLARTDIAERRLALWGSYPGRKVELWVLHNSRRLVSPKVSAFVEFPVESFPERQL